MGSLAQFDLARLIDDFGCRILVETGMGGGLNLDHALGFDFEQIYAIEPRHPLALTAALRLAKNHRVTIINAKPERGLCEVLSDIAPTIPVLFCLSGLEPGAAFRQAAGDGTVVDPGILPMERALRLLVERRDLSHDLVVVDDCRLYDGADTDLLPLRPEFRGLGFVDALLGASHQVSRSTSPIGGLCATPRRPRVGSPPC